MASMQAHTLLLPMTGVPIASSLRKSSFKSEMKLNANTRRDSTLAGEWRKIQGANDWADLINPLSPLLRDELVRYGELVAACYKAFDLDPRSRRYLNCKYGQAQMLDEVGLGGAGYQVTKYIYATPDVCAPMRDRSRWVGYVAVAVDGDARRCLGRRDVVVAFRGTVTRAEWAANMMSALRAADLDPAEPRPEVRAESGFLNLYTSDDGAIRFGQGSCRKQLLGEIARLVRVYGGEEISITLAGHSMGSALALLLGYDLAELGLNRVRPGGEPAPITVYSFGGPRAGNTGFKRRCDELGVKVLRVVNVRDPVTKLPGLLLNESSGGRRAGGVECYAHVGVELGLDFFDLRNPAAVHDLRTYITLLKCPKHAAKEEDVNLVDQMMEKVKKMVQQQGRKVVGWPWQDMVRQVGNLVQTLSMI
ncbi:phospholipase A1 EG1, chloroplastic/mitochondrial-like [Zingiber officinale]|uniref:Fungal lipase-type domain-containing protein n=1 Tax=Zingiber officinale TaxID=94328 RepID=A0A8J5G0S9_ZINOF|nr:phospholipase A1 EG1, chloroplastic/mitochondrial-like [Zingiber officinale]KAG6497431.1 hypothetical protein ZIOFF_045331 [Zingiber officinale]